MLATESALEQAFGTERSCLLRFLAHDFTIDLRVERAQQFRVLSGERKFEIVGPEHDDITARLK